ncbi:MAG: CBS domain-containing protein [Candidatus Muirbacterium halophilum]|nr:CBS domain-containing protein [Candidatus Muirbacterium halophilum]MCK9477534.1 CBS domain-containing protein [Candidatus Muirbacterium halophilum]
MGILKVKDYYTKDPVVITRDTSLRKISDIILKSKYSVIPVVNDENECIGIVTVSELLSVFIPEYLDLFGDIEFALNIEFELEISAFIDDLIIAEDILSTEYPLITPETNIVFAVAQLNKFKLNGVPVVDEEGKVQGIITLKDIISGLICYKNSCPVDFI